MLGQSSKVEAEIADLFVLLGDSDPLSFAYVNEKVRDMGMDPVDIFKEWTEKMEEGERKDFYMARIASLVERNILMRLEREIATGYPDISESFYLVTTLVFPSLQRGYFTGLYEELADKISSEVNEKRTAVENVEIFNWHFFRKYKPVRQQDYKGNTSGVLLDVLISGSGLPVMVSLVYFMLARRVGISIFPVFYKNSGYIPAFVENGRPLFFIDVSNRGQIVAITQEDCPYKCESDVAVIEIYADSLMALAGWSHVCHYRRLMEKVRNMCGEIAAEGRKY